MGLLLLLGSFAVSYAILFAAAAWVTGNLRGMESVIALFVAIASLFAYAGARGYQQWLDTHRTAAIGTGATAGALTVMALGAAFGSLGLVRHVLSESTMSLLGGAYSIFSWLAPAPFVHLTLRAARRRARPS